MASGYQVGSWTDAAELEGVRNVDGGPDWTGVLADDTRNRQLADLARNGGMVAVLVIVVVGALVFVHGFSSSYNLETVLQQSAFLGFVAVGMTFVVGTGNFIDLSVVAQIATGGIVITVLEGKGFLVAVPAAMGSCLAFALVNWLGVGVMRANSVVMTLGVETAGIGLLDYVTNGANYSSTSTGLHTAMTESVGSVPFLELRALYTQTRPGRARYPNACSYTRKGRNVGRARPRAPAIKEQLGQFSSAGASTEPRAAQGARRSRIG